LIFQVEDRDFAASQARAAFSIGPTKLLRSVVLFSSVCLKEYEDDLSPQQIHVLQAWFHAD
jgi:hypothetical protein